jgi:hypothetical protein
VRIDFGPRKGVSAYSTNNSKSESENFVSKADGIEKEAKFVPIEQNMCHNAKIECMEFDQPRKAVLQVPNSHFCLDKADLHKARDSNSTGFPLLSGRMQLKCPTALLLQGLRFSRERMGDLDPS